MSVSMNQFSLKYVIVSFTFQYTCIFVLYILCLRQIKNETLPTSLRRVHNEYK